MESDGLSTQSFSTPYDHLIPVVTEPTAKFYLDVIRVYLALCDGILTLEEAHKHTAILKRNPEYAKQPIDPTVLPISARLKSRLINNLTTLHKYNLSSPDAIRSAYSFAFLVTDVPFTESDLKILRYFAEHPNARNYDAARDLGMFSSAITKSVRRLQERNALRFCNLVDTTAFGINSFLLFFKIKPNVRWSAVETGLAKFPFTKSLLKTTMSEYGYASFLFPGNTERVNIFKMSIDSLIGDIFEYATLHTQIGMGRDTNFSLFDGHHWVFPKDLLKLLSDEEPEVTRPPRVLWCGGPVHRLTPLDFTIASFLRVDGRISPKDISKQLELSGISLDPQTIYISIRKMRSKNIFLPYIAFGGIGLSANFCFEIVCNDYWHDRILSFTPLLPSSTTFISNHGLILWLDLPSSQQVEYYRLFRALEQQDGIELVKPIMTVGPSGSRSMDDLSSQWSYSEESWTIDPEVVDLSRYLV